MFRIERNNEEPPPTAGTCDDLRPALNSTIVGLINNQK